MNSLKFLFCFLLLNTSLSAQNMYVFLIYQNDTSIGTLKDKETMLQLWEEIDEQVPQLNVSVNEINEKQTSISEIQNAIQSLPISYNDIVWVYYTGHGANYDNWPMTDEQELPLSTVNAWLEASGARLSITMYDSCNWGRPITSSKRTNGWVKSPPNFYNFLFLYSKGNIKIASCESEQFSYGSKNSGSFFTNAFVDAIRSGKATWEKVMEESKSLTETLAANSNKRQNPKCQFSNDFRDGTFY